MIKVSGHRIGTAEVESALASPSSIVVEAAVVGYPHEVKGEGIYAFVILKGGLTHASPEQLDEIRRSVRQGVGPLATPDFIQVFPALQNTHSGDQGVLQGYSGVIQDLRWGLARRARGALRDPSSRSFRRCRRRALGRSCAGF